jgi:hypothetical protein
MDEQGFRKVKRPVDATKAKRGPDRQALMAEYRLAYRTLETHDPRAVEGLPEPDGRASFDPAKALERIRASRAGLRAVPRTNVKG